MAVRKLGPVDEATVRRACALVGIESPSDPSRALSRPECIVLAAEEDEAVVGLAYGHQLVHPDGEATALLYSLDVAEGARRRGWGRGLVEAFVAEARAMGCTEVWVLTSTDNEAALATYRSAGGARDPQLPVMISWRLAPGHHS